MKASKLVQVLSYSFFATLVACGGDPAPVPVAPVVPTTVVPTAPVTVTPPSTVGGDYVRDVVAPWLESYYGRVQLQTQITVLGNGAALDTIPAGEYGWRDMYDRVVNRLATGCACSFNMGGAYPTANVYQNTSLSPLGYIDYSRFSTYVQGNAAAWQQAQVTLRPSWAPHQAMYANFAFIFNELVSMNFTYYTQYYYPVFNRVQYSPGTWAGFGGHYYGSGNSSILNIGGSYNSAGSGRSISLDIQGFFRRGY